jgi:hypothetical protein
MPTLSGAASLRRGEFLTEVVCELATRVIARKKTIAWVFIGRIILSVSLCISATAI